MLISVSKFKVCLLTNAVHTEWRSHCGVFREPAAAIDCRASGKRNTRPSLVAKVGRQLQRNTDDEVVGVEGMARPTTLPC